MHVLFEEDGAFKAATIVTDNDSSLQVETVSGKRSKIKATNVLLRYSEPVPTALLDQGRSSGQRNRARLSLGVSG
jgi:exoribonuclease-2